MTRRLQEFVYLNFRLPWDAPVPRDDNREVLLRGFAYCNQAVYVFIHLLQEKEISGRMTYLHRQDGVSPHTVAEVQLGGDWRVFDVLFNFVPTRPDGALASVRDLVAQPALLDPSRAPVEWYRYAKVRLVRGPERRRQGGPALTFARQALVRRIAGIMPSWLVDRLQDLYLQLPAAPVEDPRFADDPAAARLFFRARHHHVLLRGREASADYQEFLRRYPAHPATDHVLYYLGLVQLTQVWDAGAAIATFDQLLERFPRTVWGDEVVYLLARAHETLGNCATAAALYRRVAEGNGGGIEDAQSTCVIWSAPERARRTVILFDFGAEVLRGFHMWNVPVPLDIAFIKASGRIVSILPMKPGARETHGPMAWFRYALETREGFFKAHGIAVRHAVDIREGPRRGPIGGPNAALWRTERWRDLATGSSREPVRGMRRVA